MEEFRTTGGDDRSSRDLAAEESSGGADVWQPEPADAASPLDSPYPDTTMASGAGPDESTNPTLNRDDQTSPGAEDD